MSDEKPVVETALVAAKAKEERKALRRKERQGRLDEMLINLQYGAASDVNLRKYIGLEDSELDAAGLTKQQKFKVRQWELPKKAIAYGLEASAQFVTSMLRREREKGGVHLNIENAVIRLPEKEDHETEPIVIDVIPEQK